MKMKITKDNKGDIVYLPQGASLYQYLEDKKGIKYMITVKRVVQPTQFIILEVAPYERFPSYIKLLGNNTIYYSQESEITLMEDLDVSRINRNL